MSESKIKVNNNIRFYIKDIYAVGTAGYVISTAVNAKENIRKRGGAGAMRSFANIRSGAKGETIVEVLTQAGATATGRVNVQDPAYINCYIHARSDCLLTVLNLILTPSSPSKPTQADYDPEYGNVKKAIDTIVNDNDCTVTEAIDALMKRIREIPCRYGDEAMERVLNDISSENMRTALVLHFIRNDTTVIDKLFHMYGEEVKYDASEYNSKRYYPFYPRVDDVYVKAYAVNPDETIALCNIHEKECARNHEAMVDKYSWVHPDVNYTGNIARLLRQNLARMIKATTGEEILM